MDSQLQLTINGVKPTIIAGFLRLHYSSTLPLEISTLILEFYDEVNSFNISAEQISKFRSGQNLFGTEFTVNSCRFRCALYPSRPTENFSLQTLMDPDITKIVAYFAMFNIQRGTYFKGTLIFNEDDIVEDDERNPTDLEGDLWIKQDLNAGGIEGAMKRLDLNIWTEILLIRYKKESDKSHYKLDIKMKQKINYLWTIQGDLLGEWIGCDALKTFPSRNFPEFEKCYNWALTMIPNGTSGQIANNNYMLCPDFLNR